MKMKVSDGDFCNWNRKPPNLPSLIPSTYLHCFHTLLIPSQEFTFTLTFNWFDFLDFQTKLRILIYYSCLSPPICLEIVPSQHIIQSPFKLGSKYTPLAFWNQGTTTILRTLTQRQKHVNKMFGNCPSKLHGEMLSMRF